jgi:hypothetical protein
METFNFRKAFGLLTVVSSSIAVFIAITLIFTSGLDIRSMSNVQMLSSMMMIALFALTGFCASLVKERYAPVSFIGMIASLLAMGLALLAVLGMLSTERVVTQFTFVFSSTAFVAGYISLLLTTLRADNSVLNRFIWGTIALLCIMWGITQATIFLGFELIVHIYQYIGVVYLLTLLGGVWVFVLSRMGVSEPKKWQDDMFRQEA